MVLQAELLRPQSHTLVKPPLQTSSLSGKWTVANLVGDGLTRRGRLAFGFGGTSLGVGTPLDIPDGMQIDLSVLGALSLLPGNAISPLTLQALQVNALDNPEFTVGIHEFWVDRAAVDTSTTFSQTISTGESTSFVWHQDDSRLAMDSQGNPTYPIGGDFHISWTLTNNANQNKFCRIGLVHKPRVTGMALAETRAVTQFGGGAKIRLHLGNPQPSPSRFFNSTLFPVGDHLIEFLAWETDSKGVALKLDPAFPGMPLAFGVEFALLHIIDPNAAPPGTGPVGDPIITDRILTNRVA